MAKSIKQFSESSFGILFLSIIPAVVTYISLLKDFKLSALFKNQNEYYALYVSVIVYLGLLLILYARKQIIVFKRKQDERFQELKDTLASRASTEAVMKNLVEINSLWEERNKTNRQVATLVDLTDMHTKTLSTTVLAIVAFINSHQTADEIARIRDILYGRATIPEYEKIGISTDILNAMRERYYSENKEIYQGKLSHLNQANNDV